MASVRLLPLTHPRCAQQTQPWANASDTLTAAVSRCHDYRIPNQKLISSFPSAAGQTCGEDATLNPLCDGLPAPGTSTTTPSEQEVCEADQYFWCATYSLCCSGSAACSLYGDGNPQCGEGETVSPPVVNPPTQSPPISNPPGGNNGSTSRSSISRTSTSRSSTPTRSSSSSTTTATAAGSNNNAVKGANSMGVVGALGAVGLVVVLMA
ncbi:hypothetical protein M408DRAFT_13099 [Serendipita vermifera MAFF 305830]|uniref:Uncharacterized protein n=1 Tax=Serendipita vermifera MAFF 305830 TaxID=933852 RepID=A0A0C3AJM4_SERVB|nr:hypothetical protein M408DRAFT_13099 [Serendipita vermifera MAFF 305830]